MRLVVTGGAGFVGANFVHGAVGRRPKLYGSGANVRDWIRVDDGTCAFVDKLRQGSA